MDLLKIKLARAIREIFLVVLFYHWIKLKLDWPDPLGQFF